MQKRLADSARAFSDTARNPNLLRAQLAFGAAWTAEWAFMVALGVIAFRDGGATAVGVVAFARMAPAFVLAPFGTALADRFPRDRVLVWSSAIRAAATAAATLFLAAGGPTVAVYALATLATAAFTVFRPAHTALLPSLTVTPLQLTNAAVVRGLVDSVSTLLGPLVAALLLDVGSPTAVFGFTAIMSVASGALLLGLSYEAAPRTAPQPWRRIVRETMEGYRTAVGHPEAGVLLRIGLAQTLTRGFLNVFLVVVALDLIRSGDSGVGVLTAAIGAGAVAGSLGASMFVRGRHLAVLEGIGVMLWGVPLALCGLFPYEAAVLALMSAIGVGNALVDVGLFSLPARLVPETLLARVFGAFESLAALSVAIGALVAPLAINALGIRGALAVLGLVAPTLVALSWWRLRAIDASFVQRDAEVEVLTSVGMFGALPMPAIDCLAVHLRHAHLAAGEEVFHQGDDGDRFYVIDQGAAEVIGDGRLIRTMGPGDSFGEIALLRDTVRTATVRASTPLALHALERRHFVSAVTGYRSSAREAASVADDRLETFTPVRVSLG